MGGRAWRVSTRVGWEGLEGEYLSVGGRAWRVST